MQFSWRAAVNSAQASSYSFSAASSVAFAFGSMSLASTLPSNSDRRALWHEGREKGDMACFLESVFQSAIIASISSKETPTLSTMRSNVVSRPLFESSRDLTQSDKAISTVFNLS